MLYADEPALGDPGAVQLPHSVGRRPGAQALPVSAELPGGVYRLGGGRTDQRGLFEQHQAAAAPASRARLTISLAQMSGRSGVRRRALS